LWGKQYLDSSFGGDDKDLSFYASFYGFNVCVLECIATDQIVTLLRTKKEILKIVTEGNSIPHHPYTIDPLEEDSFRQWLLGKTLYQVEEKSPNVLLLYKVNDSQYYITMKDDVQGQQNNDNIALQLHKKRLDHFWNIQRYASQRSYSLHEMYDEGNYNTVEVIKAASFEPIQYPYVAWMKEPLKFEKVLDGMVSLTYKTNWQTKQNVLEYLQDLVQYFHKNERHIEVIDVQSLTVHDEKFSFEDLVLYFEQKEHEIIYNQISFEISLTKLKSIINTPQFVRNLDLMDHVWTVKKKPLIQCYLLTSVKNCYTDFHIDMNGSAVWYHVVIGKKIFCLIEPTETNLKSYSFWMGEEKNESDSFLDSCSKATVSFAIIETSDTFLIPPGYIHAVYTAEDTIAFRGNYFDVHCMVMHLKISNMEDHLNIPSNQRCPLFSEFCMFTLSYVMDMNNQVFCLDNKESIISLIQNCKKWLAISDKKDYYFIRHLVRKNIVEKHKIKQCHDLLDRIKALYVELEKENNATTLKPSRQTTQTADKKHKYDTRNNNVTRVEEPSKKRTPNNIGIDFKAPVFHFPINNLQAIEKEARCLKRVYCNPSNATLNSSNKNPADTNFMSLKDVDRICRTCPSGQDFNSRIIEFWIYWMTRFDCPIENKDYHICLPELYNTIKEKNFVWKDVEKLVPRNLIMKDIIMIPVFDCYDEWELCVILNPKLYNVGVNSLIYDDDSESCATKTFFSDIEKHMSPFDDPIEDDDSINNNSSDKCSLCSKEKHETNFELGSIEIHDDSVMILKDTVLKSCMNLQDDNVIHKEHSCNTSISKRHGGDVVALEGEKMYPDCDDAMPKKDIEVEKHDHQNASLKCKGDDCSGKEFKDNSDNDTPPDTSTNDEYE
jgi:hypothetical protein